MLGDIVFQRPCANTMLGFVGDDMVRSFLSAVFWQLNRDVYGGLLLSRKRAVLSGGAAPPHPFAMYPAQISKYRQAQVDCPTLHQGASARSEGRQKADER